LENPNLKSKILKFAIKILFGARFSPNFNGKFKYLKYRFRLYSYCVVL